AELTRFIGPPLRGTFAELLATTEAGLIADAVCAYRERFSTVGLFENAVYAGIPEVLGAVRGARHRAFVVTSKPHVYARRIVDHFGLSPWLEDVFGSELSGENTDKRDLIRVALERICVGGDRAWMIGDRGTDIAGARVNGIGAIAAAWGYGSEAELRAARPDFTFATPTELRAFVSAPRPR
ncbi:MAG TPA: HAD hydrolase-like protein, partial [Polyangia bacterium]|nr:HAD hydrolase-like protein [Polyangia bacterium]